MSTHVTFFRTLGFCMVIFLGGCSVYSLPGSDPVPVESEPEYVPVPSPETSPKPEPYSSEPEPSSAYRSLTDKAEQAASVGDYEQALALLERAQRIGPDNAEIYLKLAETYHSKGDHSLATATAERGLLYCNSRALCDALRNFTR